MSHLQNCFLDSLSKPQLEGLKPHLSQVALEQHQVLYEVGDRVSYTYVPFNAVVSIVVVLSTGQMIEAAMVGRMAWWLPRPR